MKVVYLEDLAAEFDMKTQVQVSSLFLVVHILTFVKMTHTHTHTTQHTHTPTHPPTHPPTHTHTHTHTGCHLAGTEPPGDGATDRGRR